MTDTTSPEAKTLSTGLKTLLDFGPIIAFFAANWYGGIFVATMVIMATTPISVAVSWFITRKLSVMPIITMVLVAIFGGLTLYLHDETFIKIKVTIINLLFAGILLIGLAFKKLLLKFVFGEAMNLDEAGWKKITLNWGLFFLGLALLNELVWRNVATDTWVSYKTFGILPLTLVFALTQMPIIQRHMLEDEDDADSSG